MTNLTHISFLYIFISILYMFRAFKCSSSGDSIVSIRYPVYVTLCRWPSGMQVWTERPNLCKVSDQVHVILSDCLHIHNSHMFKCPLVSQSVKLTTTFLQCGQWPRWRKVVAQILWPVPEAAFTVLCSPDDGCDGHPKYVESDFAVNKYLHTVASCWILII